jgi:CRP/FNR family transcriptional regulator
VIFSRHDPALYIYNVTEGIVRSYRERASGRRQVLAFLFAGDLIGLSSRGRYVNSTETLTPVTVFRFPLAQLVALASGDATLAWTLMCKSNQTLREAQRHTLLVSCTDPAARVAMFLSVMENTAPGGRGRIPVPLGVADIAEYVDLAPAAVTRALSDLQRGGVIRRDGAKAVRIADRLLFDTLVAGGHL